MDNKNIKEKITTLLTHLGFNDALVKVTKEEDQIRANISCLPEVSGILIGRHGEGIDALQLIVNLIINKNTDEWQRVLVNVNDYREAREETIIKMTEGAAENAITTGKEVVLNYLPSHERRIAHMYLDKNQEVHTYSQGEGKYRRLIIAPSNN